MSVLKVVGTTPTGNRDELFTIKHWEFFGDTKNWTPEVVPIIEDAIESCVFAHGTAWNMLFPSMRQGLVVREIMQRGLRRGDWSEAELAAARLIGFDFCDC